jgi:hypothetical protein
MPTIDETPQKLISEPAPANPSVLVAPRLPPQMLRWLDGRVGQKYLTRGVALRDCVRECMAGK